MLERLFVELQESGSDYVIMGDFNQNILEGHLSILNCFQKFGFQQFVQHYTTEVVFSTSYECSPVAYQRTKCNITRQSELNTLVWNKDDIFQFSSAYQASNSCIKNPPTTEYAEYCFEDSPNYIFILEILKPENHDGKPDDLTRDDLTTNIPDNTTGDTVDVSVSVPCSKPQPTFIWNINYSKSKSPHTIENSQISTDNTGCTSPLLKRLSSLSVNLNDLDPEITKANGDIDISVDVKFGDYKTVSSVPVTLKYIAQGSPSPSTPSPSTPLQTTSSPSNSLINVTSESSTSTTPTPVCDNLICECDIICIIIIISVCVGSLIVVVVIIICCCCCSFCPCYKRNEENRDGTECKCCCLICVCCRRNNNKHDEESEGREKVCECCCCPFCLCFKRNKKPSGRKHNQNATKSESRSQQYEMNRTNRPNQMHPGSNYHIRRPDHRTRTYQPASATQFAHPKEYYYGQGYNNAAFVYYGESELRRDMDRKPRVNQRPLTNYY
ncbi:hypothetical protein LOTGIDRAFT_158045 [Lottia gigantea]|uniref:Uncharacterized protein n=1 Tax=Lottia gigantea TaxID=225164 RepID=V4A7H2_LOTGI|nr:hypothetical protein LOTGIDRAFT_158045 [Lottia gigantea]ESO99888.1 hypothetical protein LOTGIDRAFT_158045 [Lottia gigantea]